MTKFIRRTRIARSRYGWPSFAGDLSGGFLASLIAFPYGLAMAALMGLPPILGVYTSILTAPFTALLGRNPVMIGGVSSVTIPFIAAAVREQGIGGAAKVSFTAAIFMLMFRALRLGGYGSKVPHAVMAGFSCGIGGMMVLSQLRTIMGLPGATQSGSPGGQLWAALTGIMHVQPATFVIASIVIVFATIAARISPRLPGPLIGIVASVLIASVFGWSASEVGVLPVSLPPLAILAWRSTDLQTIVPAGFGLAIVASVNLLVTSRVVDHFRGRHQAMNGADADQELGAYGIANLAAGMFGAPMSVGIPARSLANVQCGATTRLSNLFHAGFLILFLMEGSQLIAHIPLAALAAVTAWMGVRLMEWSTWRRLHRMRRTDAIAFLSTASVAVFGNGVVAVALGCACYFVASVLVRNHGSGDLAPEAQLPSVL